MAGGRRAALSNRRRKARGFTLVEVLVALFVMALMAGLAWRGLDGVLRSRDAGRDAVDRSVLLTTLLSQWQTDLQSIYQSNVLPATLAFDGRHLRLTRLSEGGVQLVVWWVDGERWQRWTSRPTTTAGELQQAWLRSQQLQTGDRDNVSLLEAVTEWQVYFYRGNAWTNAQSSGDLQLESATRAPTEANPGGTANAAPEQLPLAVRLVLTVDGKTLTRDIPVVPRS